MVSLSHSSIFLFGCWLLVVVLGVLIRPTVGQTTATTCSPATRKTRPVLKLAGLSGILPESRPEVYNILARRPLPLYLTIPGASGAAVDVPTRNAIPEKKFEAQLTNALRRVLKQAL